jgi:hypothetical protein
MPCDLRDVGVAISLEGRRDIGKLRSAVGGQIEGEFGRQEPKSIQDLEFRSKLEPLLKRITCRLVLVQSIDDRQVRVSAKSNTTVGRDC